MNLTILQILQEVAALTKQPSTFTSAVGSSDANVRLMLALAHDDLEACRSRFDWPTLTRDYFVTLATGQESYALPGDFHSFINETSWDRGLSDPLIGPITPAEWAANKYGITPVSIWKQFRVKGRTDKRFFVYPTPGSGDNGVQLAIEYISKSTCRPKDWSAAEGITINQYRWANGLIYKCTVAGTTGSTAPSHTSGTATDGTVTWSVFTDSYDRFLADTDRPLFDSDLLKMGIRWRWMRENGLDYGPYQAEWERKVGTSFAENNGASVLSLVPKTRFRLIDEENLPDTLDV